MKNGPYELVIAPADYPGKKYRGRYVYEHHLVWWKETGEVVDIGFVVHHKNEKKRDNRFSNLEKKTKSKHTSEHHAPAEKVTLVCSWCQKKFRRYARCHREKLKLGQTAFYCGRSHQVHAQHHKKHIPR